MKNIIITPKLLDEWGTCTDGKAWGLSVIGKGRELKKLLPKFRRADWLLWTLRKADALTRVQFVELAIICAKTVLDIYEKKYPKDKRPRLAIEAAIAYCKNPTGKNGIVADAAYAADAAAYTAADAADAADAAAYAASYAAVDALKNHHIKMCKLLVAAIRRMP